jgi:hypothetical protein
MVSATSPSEYRPQGATVFGLYSPQRQEGDFGPVYFSSRLVQYRSDHLVKYLTRIYPSLTEAYVTSYQKQEQSYHGLVGIATQEGVQNFSNTIDTSAIFPITNNTPEPQYGTPLIGFYHVVEDQAVQYWKIVVRSPLADAGTHTVDTGVVYEVDSWYEMSIVRNQTNGNLTFTIQKDDDDSVEIVILGTDVCIPYGVNAVDEPLYLGKVHYGYAAVNDQAISIAFLQWVDYDTSKFTESMDEPHPGQQE